MNDMDKRIADDPTLTDAQKLQHKFGNAFIPLNMAIDELTEGLDDCDGLDSVIAVYDSKEIRQVAAARDTYLDEMREMIERMGEAKNPLYDALRTLDTYYGNAHIELKLRPGMTDFQKRQIVLEREMWLMVRRALRGLDGLSWEERCCLEPDYVRILAESSHDQIETSKDGVE